MTLPAAAWLAALSIMATACKEKVSYEGPDLAGSRAAFGCDKSPSGDAADACRMLTEFESAGTVRPTPTSTRGGVGSIAPTRSTRRTA